MSIPLQFDKVLTLPTDDQLLQRRLDIAFSKISDFSKVYNVGITDGSDALVGQIGEYKTAFRSFNSSPVSLSNAITSNITSLLLTPGDWDVWGTVIFIPAATTTVSLFYLGITIISGVLGLIDDGFITYSRITYPAGVITYQTLPTPICRISIASSTIIYLSANSEFGVSTMDAGGTIKARRVR